MRKEENEWNPRDSHVYKYLTSSFSGWLEHYLWGFFFCKHLGDFQVTNKHPRTKKGKKVFPFLWKVLNFFLIWQLRIRFTHLRLFWFFSLVRIQRMNYRLELGQKWLNEWKLTCPCQIVTHEKSLEIKIFMCEYEYERSEKNWHLYLDTVSAKKRSKIDLTLGVAKRTFAVQKICLKSHDMERKLCAD